MLLQQSVIAKPGRNGHGAGDRPGARRLQAARYAVGEIS
jgi:hypothetical protein